MELGQARLSAMLQPQAQRRRLRHVRGITVRNPFLHGGLPCDQLWHCSLDWQPAAHSADGLAPGTWQHLHTTEQVG